MLLLWTLYSLLWPPDALSLLSFFSFSFLVHSRLTPHFLPLKTCISSDFRHLFWGFHGRHKISHPSNRRSYFLSCHARPTRTAILYLLHTSTQTSPLHFSSPSFVLHVCTVKQISPPFSLFSPSFLSILSLSPLSLSSFAPEPFPFDPV